MFSSPPPKQTSRDSQLGTALALVDVALHIKEMEFLNPNLSLVRLRETTNVVALYTGIGK